MSGLVKKFVFDDRLRRKKLQTLSSSLKTATTDFDGMRSRKIRKTNEIHEKNLKHRKYIPGSSMNNQIYYTIQALLLTGSRIALGYHSIYYGPLEYSLLENGQIVNGLVPLRKAVVILSVGYPVQYAIICILTSCMLLYSILSMKPQWSLPLIVLTMADLVCNIGDSIVAFWLLFTRLHFYTAVFYASVVTSIILGQLWVWLGVVRLYELRTFI